MKNPLRWILLAVFLITLAGAQKVSAAVRSVPAANDADINIRQRGWVENTSFPKALQPHPNAADPKAPQLSTLIGDAENHNPIFTYLGQVKARGGQGLDSSNIQSPGIGKIQANGGATIYSPRQGYDIGGGYSYVVLYATNTDIVIHNTTADSVASGYTLHIFDINVDKKLLDLYNQNEANGRPQLVAIGCHIPLGTVAGSSVLESIRDTGSFMDNRYNDWWKLSVLKTCKETPPGLLSAAKKPPKGEFLPNDPIDVPKTVETKQNPDVSIGSSVTGGGASLDTSFFAGATFYDASVPNNKLNELFQPAAPDGGKLVPAGLQDQVQTPSQQDYPPGSPEALGRYNEVYDPGCTKSGFVGSDKISEEQYAKNAAEAKLPDVYPDFQANLHNLGSILVPGKTSSLQWQIKDPGIAVKGADGKLTLSPQYATRFHCGAQIDPKQVSAVTVPVTGPIEAIFSTVIDIVKSTWSLITGEETVCDSNGKCYTYNKYKATLVTTNTATIKTPAMRDVKDQAIGQMGALFAFQPNAIKDKLPKDDGFTNKNQGGGNVLAATTDPNDPASFPHGGTYAVAKTWQLTSSCMLIPASIQEQRSTDCKLEGGGAAPAPSSTTTTPPACNANNPSNVTSGPKNTYLSDGLIALAIKVSRYTCTPAEFIVGTLMGETRGLNFDGTTNFVIKGDPNESICRTSPCVKNQTGDLGPFSWSQFLYEDQFKTFAPFATDCFNAVGAGSTPDSRLLGQDMCITATKFWSSMHDNGKPVGSCSGANQKSYNLDDIALDKRRLAYMHFCGAAAVCEQLWQKDQELIDAYKAAVARVKGEMASCLR